MEASKATFQEELHSLLVEKEQQIEKIHIQFGEEEKALRREMHHISVELDSKKKEIYEKQQKLEHVESMGVQTVFFRNHQETQTQPNLHSMKSSVMINGVDSK